MSNQGSLMTPESASENLSRLLVRKHDLESQQNALRTQLARIKADIAETDSSIKVQRGIITGFEHARKLAEEKLQQEAREREEQIRQAEIDNATSNNADADTPQTH